MIWLLWLSLISGSVKATRTTLPLCGLGKDNYTHLPSLCQVGNAIDYSPSEYPQPQPCIVHSKIRIKQLLDVDEDHETFTLFLEYTLTWNDTRIGIAKSEQNIQNGREWFPLLESTLDEVWTPSLVFTNAISVDKLNTYAQDKMRRFYLFQNSESQYFYYQVFLVIKITCDLDFQAYPFDHQTCELHYAEIIGHTGYVVLKPPVIKGKNVTIFGNSTKIASGILPFDSILKAVDTDDNIVNSFNYSKVGVSVELVRDETALHQLMGSYFAPTSIFTVISMFSFFIKPELVSRIHCKYINEN